jgi:hypothetical protein
MRKRADVRSARTKFGLGGNPSRRPDGGTRRGRGEPAARGFAWEQFALEGGAREGRWRQWTRCARVDGPDAHELGRNPGVSSPHCWGLVGAAVHRDGLRVRVGRDRGSLHGCRGLAAGRVMGRWLPLGSEGRQAWTSRVTSRSTGHGGRERRPMSMSMEALEALPDGNAMRL